MNRNTWRVLASGLMAATLSLGIAACDDDTSSGTGDMAVGADMSAGVDMTMEGAPGIGQIVLADVVGNVYTPDPNRPVLPRTHSLLALASLPVVVPMSDPSSNLNLAPPSGCTINRFSATNVPPDDGDAGVVTISGWSQAVIGISAATQTASVGSSMYPIECARSDGSGGTPKRYACGFSGTANADGGGMGMTTGSVIFPLIPFNIVDHATHTVIMNIPPPQGWPSAFPCIPRYVYNKAETDAGNAACTPTSFYTNPTTCTTAVEVCEQSPVLVGGSNITEAIGGGTDYPAKSVMLGTKDNADAGSTEFPQPLYLISVKQGGADLSGTDTGFTGGPTLSMADGAIDPTKALTITFSCDGSTTAGGGCAGNTDLAALLITTSEHKKELFSLASAETGSAECIAAVSAGGTISIAANQLTALVGSQTGGSFEMALARLRLTAMASGSHTTAFGAGMGIFGFTNQ